MIVPVYKKEKTITKDLKRIYQVIQKLRYPTELICVIDGKVDRSFEKASKFKLFHERVEFIQGSAASSEIVETLTRRVKGKKVLITLDSKHSKENALNEIKQYAPLVSRDSYLVVQDTHVDGYPNVPDFGPGPYEAMQEFLKTDENFVIDRSREKFLLTFYPSGYLKRIK